MGNDRRNGSQGPSTPGQGLVVQLTIEPGEPLAGSATVEGTDRHFVFSGWLGLVELLTVFRRHDGREAAPGSVVGLSDGGANGSPSPTSP